MRIRGSFAYILSSSEPTPTGLLADRPFLSLAAVLPARAFPRHNDTGFLNRHVTVNSVTYKYQVYVPENWNEHTSWPVILFLHGSGERGSEGMDETQIGLPQAIRLHPDRWPFIVVMPQVPFGHRHWTDADMMQMALAALDQDTKEFHGDRDRTYLTGLSLGGYGVYELARYNPHRFAAIVPVSGGVFWSYKPDRWRESAILPGEYARAIGRTPIWIFHGADDNVVSAKQAALMYDALKTAGGNVRYWEYAGWRHNAWDKAYANPDLPRWLLEHHLSIIPKLCPLPKRSMCLSIPCPPKSIPRSTTTMSAITRMQAPFRRLSFARVIVSSPGIASETRSSCCPRALRHSSIPPAAPPASASRKILKGKSKEFDFTTTVTKNSGKRSTKRVSHPLQSVHSRTPPTSSGHHLTMNIQ